VPWSGAGGVARAVFPWMARALSSNRKRGVQCYMRATRSGVGESGRCEQLEGVSAGLKQVGSSAWQGIRDAIGHGVGRNGRACGIAPPARVWLMWKALLSTIDNTRVGFGSTR
jgi:hypothetical protein